VVIVDHKFNLNKPISPEEVDQLIQEIPNGKAPGPDGFTVNFFKACSDLVKMIFMA